MTRDLTYILVVAVALILLAMGVKFALAYDPFVSMIERREGMLPGQTKVLPDCSCTIRYLGTTVHGRRYDVHIERLD